MIWDLYQQAQISQAKAEVSEAKNEAGRMAARVSELEFSHQRMALISQAMWEILRSRFDVDEAELLAKINEIDLRDGKKDMRMSAQVATCPECRKTVNTKNPRCIYCGTPLKKPHVFQ